MTINHEYNVDTALAAVDVDTLMTRAFALTHRIHDAQRAPVTAARQGDYEDDLRAERDAIVREMRRRSDALDRMQAVNP